MSTTRHQFHAGGPLDPTDKLYVERRAPDGGTLERYILKLLRDSGSPPMINIIEPRQQGKTSLLLWLRAAWLASGGSVGQGVGYSYIDAAAAVPSGRDCDAWCKAVGNAIVKQLGDGQVERSLLPEPPSGEREWYEFLQKLAKMPVRAVVALDELGAMAFPGSDYFFSCIRAITTIDQRKLTFIFAGCFSPTSLIKNPNQSPFNVATDVSLPDLSARDVATLVSLGMESAPSEIADEIHKWTGGHPYLTQRLCELVSGAAGHAASVSAAARYCTANDRHFEGIREVLRRDQSLSSILRQVIDGSMRLRFVRSDTQHESHRLWAAGLVRDNAGQCAIRNRMYAEAFWGPSTEFDLFISYRRGHCPEYLPELLFCELTGKGRRVFLDRKSVHAGNFSPQLLRAIDNSLGFLLILSPGCLDRCSEPGDWLVGETLRAIEAQCKIVIVATDGFEMPSQGADAWLNIPPQFKRLLLEQHHFPVARPIEATVQVIELEMFNQLA